jgi:hypothetical protein
MRRANQRICLSCRLFKAAAWHDGRTTECRLCGGRMIQWARGKGYDVCGWCLLVRQPDGPTGAVPGTCGHQAKGTCHSGTPTPLYSERVSLCFPCLTDPAKFKLNQQAIMRKARELTAGRSSATVDVGTDGPAGPEQESE